MMRKPLPEGRRSATRSSPDPSEPAAAMGPVRDGLRIQRDVAAACELLDAGAHHAPLAGILDIFEE
eukprot:scaffold1618_cov158-Pinguiococcus_pyrenoidosus.AAC.3